MTATSYPGSFHYAPRWRKDPGPGWSRVSQILGDNNWDLWGREGKCGVRVQNNTRSVNKATQRTTMKRSFYWHIFFIKYVVTVGTKLLIRPGWTFETLRQVFFSKPSQRHSLAGLVLHIYQEEKAESSENFCCALYSAEHLLNQNHDWILIDICERL